MAVAAQTITRDDLRIYAFTRDAVRRSTIDSVYSHSPAAAIFFGRTLGDFGPTGLSGRGKRNQVGGHSVQHRVRLGKHTGSKRMAGPTDTHSVDLDDNVRLGELNWSHYSGALTITAYDKGVNRGAEAMGSFIRDQTISVERSLIDMLVQDFFAAASPSNAITSVDALISAASGTASAMGLSGSTYANWNARGISARGTAGASVSFASGSFAAQGISDMRTCYNNASEGSIQPNVILTDYDTHERYEGSLQPQERFAGAVRTADGSFQSLAFRTKPVMADPNVTSGYMYQLRADTEDGVHTTTLDGFDFMFDDFKMASNQEVAVSELMWKGDVGVGNRRYGSNKMTGITD